MQTPEPIPIETFEVDEPQDRYSPDVAWLWGLGERLTWMSGLILALTPLMGWYVNPGEPTRRRDRVAHRPAREDRLLLGLAIVALASPP